MFRIIQNMFLMWRIPPKHDTPVGPLGLWRIGLLMCYTPVAPLGLYT